MTQRPRLTQLPRSEIKLPPVASELTELRSIGPRPAPGTPTVYVWADALTELIYAGLRRPDDMQAAILVGGLYAGPGQMFIELRGYTDLERFEDTRDFSRNLGESWIPLTNRLARREEGLSILGWACIRKDQGSEPARDLQITQRSFFNLAHQLMLTIDPVHQEVALYGFDESGGLVQIGFQLVIARRGRDLRAEGELELRSSGITTP